MGLKFLLHFVYSAQKRRFKLQPTLKGIQDRTASLICITLNIPNFKKPPYIYKEISSFEAYSTFRSSSFFSGVGTRKGFLNVLCFPFFSPTKFSHWRETLHTLSKEKISNSQFVHWKKGHKNMILKNSFHHYFPNYYHDA